MLTTEQKQLYHPVSLGSQKKSTPYNVFVIFFHPSTSVTAMGGAEKRFVETLRFFCAKGSLKITVLESSPSLLDEPEINCKKYLLSSCFHGKRWLSTYLEWAFWTAKASIRSFSLFCPKKPYAIVVPNNTLPNLFSGYVASLLSDSPLLAVVHHIDVPFSKAEESENRSVYDCYRSIRYSRLVALAKTLTFYTMLSILKKAKGIIAVSNFTARALKNNGVSHVKISVSGNAIDFKLINSVKPHAHRRIYDGVFVGRVAKEKGIYDLLKVWKKVIKVNNNAKLLVIGSGLEFARVKKRVVESGLENKVFVKGRCSDLELYSLLKSSKVFIFPSIFEGWGIAVAEALACGLPVVAYDIPALRENFGKCRSVFLTPVKNIEKMASTTLKILNSNKKELLRLASSSRVYSRQFVWEDVAKKDLGFLEDCLKIRGVK